MELRDVRRLAVTTLLLTLAVAAWLAMLALHRSGAIYLQATHDALVRFSLGTWTWMAMAAALLLTLLLASAVLATRLLPRGWAKGSVRQVQCDQCKAVFLMADTGHRPITHRCPNCKCLGVYDGKAKPVGEAPVGARDVVKLALRCRNCAHRFSVIDTGVRPLRITCPKCRAVGGVR